MNWQTIFDGDGDAKKAVAVGQRLGLPYTRTLLPQLELQVKNSSIGMEEPKIVRIDQDGMGMIAISGVVWDCGLYLADYLCSSQIANVHSNDTISISENLNAIELETVLDIGCGTGICGVVAATLGAKRVIFTDAVFTDAFEANFDILQQDSSVDQVTDAIKWRWSENASEEIPTLITHSVRAESEQFDVHRPCCWSTILCSDVLYEKSCLPALQLLLRRLSFKKLILAYKKRHEEPEQAFFQNISTWCTVLVMPKDQIEPVNLPTKNVDENLFLLIVIPFCSNATERYFSL